jgi:CPA2 family monovalent cation:H+ antiporter-2
MILTPLISSQTTRLYALKKRWFRHEILESSNIPDDGLSGHVVIAGGGRVGFQIAKVLKRLHIQFVIIELDHRRFEQARVAEMAVVYGNANQQIVLEAAGIKNAKLLILTLPGLVEARSVIIHSKLLNSRIEIIARTSGPDYFELLWDLGVSDVVLPEFEAGLEMTRQALLRLQVPPTEVHRNTDTLRQEIYAHLFDQEENYRVLSQLRNADQQFDLQWIRLDQESPIAYRSIGESEIRKRTGVSVVGVVREKQLWPNPDANFVLLPDDLIATIGSEKSRETFRVMAASKSL